MRTQTRTINTGIAENVNHKRLQQQKTGILPEQALQGNILGEKSARGSSERRRVAPPLALQGDTISLTLRAMLLGSR